MKSLSRDPLIQCKRMMMSNVDSMMESIRDRPKLCLRGTLSESVIFDALPLNRVYNIHDKEQVSQISHSKIDHMKCDIFSVCKVNDNVDNVNISKFNTSEFDILNETDREIVCADRMKLKECGRDKDKSEEDELHRSPINVGRPIIGVSSHKNRKQIHVNQGMSDDIIVSGMCTDDDINVLRGMCTDDINVVSGMCTDDNINRLKDMCTNDDINLLRGMCTDNDINEVRALCTDEEIDAVWGVCTNNVINDTEENCDKSDKISLINYTFPSVNIISKTDEISLGHENSQVQDKVSMRFKSQKDDLPSKHILHDAILTKFHTIKQANKKSKFSERKSQKPLTKECSKKTKVSYVQNTVMTPQDMTNIDLANYDVAYGSMLCDLSSTNNCNYFEDIPLTRLKYVTKENSSITHHCNRNDILKENICIGNRGTSSGSAGLSLYSSSIQRDVACKLSGNDTSNIVPNKTTTEIRKHLKQKTRNSITQSKGLVEVSKEAIFTSKAAERDGGGGDAENYLMFETEDISSPEKYSQQTFQEIKPLTSCLKGSYIPKTKGDLSRLSNQKLWYEICDVYSGNCDMSYFRTKTNDAGYMEHTLVHITPAHYELAKTQTSCYNNLNIAESIFFQDADLPNSFSDSGYSDDAPYAGIHVSLTEHDAMCYVDPHDDVAITPTTTLSADYFCQCFEKQHLKDDFLEADHTFNHAQVKTPQVTSLNCKFNKNNTFLEEFNVNLKNTTPTGKHSPSNNLFIPKCEYQAFLTQVQSQGLETYDEMLEEEILSERINKCNYLDEKYICKHDDKWFAIESECSCDSEKTKNAYEKSLQCNNIDGTNADAWSSRRSLQTLFAFDDMEIKKSNTNLGHSHFDHTANKKDHYRNNVVQTASHNLEDTCLFTLFDDETEKGSSGQDSFINSTAEPFSEITHEIIEKQITNIISPDHINCSNVNVDDNSNEIDGCKEALITGSSPTHMADSLFNNQISSHSVTISMFDFEEVCKTIEVLDEFSLEQYQYEKPQKLRGSFMYKFMKKLFRHFSKDLTSEYSDVQQEKNSQRQQSNKSEHSKILENNIVDDVKKKCNDSEKCDISSLCILPDNTFFEPYNEFCNRNISSEDTTKKCYVLNCEQEMSESTINDWSGQGVEPEIRYHCLDNLNVKTELETCKDKTCLQFDCGQDVKGLSDNNHQVFSNGKGDTKRSDTLCKKTCKVCQHEEDTSIIFGEFFKYLDTDKNDEVSVEKENADKSTDILQIEKNNQSETVSEDSFNTAHFKNCATEVQEKHASCADNRQTKAAAKNFLQKLRWSFISKLMKKLLKRFSKGLSAEYSNVKQEKISQTQPNEMTEKTEYSSGEITKKCSISNCEQDKSECTHTSSWSDKTAEPEIRDNCLDKLNVKTGLHICKNKTCLQLDCEQDVKGLSHWEKNNHHLVEHGYCKGDTKSSETLCKKICKVNQNEDVTSIILYDIFKYLDTKKSDKLTGKEENAVENKDMTQRQNINQPESNNEFSFKIVDFKNNPTELHEKLLYSTDNIRNETADSEFVINVIESDQNTSEKMPDPTEQHTQGFHSDEPVEHVPSDLLQSSLECLLEMLLQRGKVIKAFVANFEGEVMAKSADFECTPSDVKSLVFSVTSKYTEMIKITLFNDVYTCFKHDRDSLLIGHAATGIFVAHRGKQSIVVGFSNPKIPGSCIKEVQEISLILNKRGL